LKNADAVFQATKLGLPIVKALNDSFGGEARFANGEGEVVITLRLPRQIA